MTPVALMKPQREPFDWDYAAQPKEHVEACNACGSTLWVTLCDRDRYGFPVSAHCCHSCGLIFLSPRMTAEAYTEFNRETYRDLIEWYCPGAVRPSEKTQTMYAEGIIPILEPFVRHPGTLLDIGGAPGVCAERVSKSLGVAEYTVVDPAGGTIPESFETWDPGGRKWAVILCCQTVDHLLDLRGSLEKMRELLTDDGILWIDILDCLYLLRRWRSVQTAIKVDHPYNLNEVTFLLLLAEIGLEPVRLVYRGSHIGFVCKKGTADPTAIMREGHKNPILANVRKKDAESKWTSATER